MVTVWTCMARAGLDKESEMCGSEWEGWRMGGGGDSAICGLGILLTWYFTGFTCIHPNTICMGEAPLPAPSGICLCCRPPAYFLRIWAFYADFWPETYELCGLFWAKMSLFTPFWETVGHYFWGVVGHQILPNVYFCSRHAPGNMTTCTGVWWECGDVRVSRDNHRTRWLPAAHT